MNLEIFKRNIKLQELGITKLSIKEQELLDFLNDNLTDLNTYTSDEYANFLFFGKDIKNIILKYKRDIGYLYVQYDKIWVFFESKFDIQYTEIQSLMRWWVGDNLHLKISHIRTGVFSRKLKLGYQQLDNNLFKNT